MNTAIAAIPHRMAKWSLTWALLLIVLSLFALTIPLITSFGALVIIGWLLVFSGVTQALHAFHSKAVGNILWKLFVATLYFVLGMYLLTNQLVGITSLTLILGIFFLAEGGIDLAAYIKAWRSDASLWILVEALATLILGVMILRQWPSDSLWAIGTLVGIGMLTTGISRLMISLAVYRLSESPRLQH
jgi:uncharacterized membrane protein HdeD (DUF308 family)